MRFGLLQAYPGDDERPAPGYYPEVGDEEQMSWSSASLALLDEAPWESESLKFVYASFDGVEDTAVEPELIPMRILMLGNSPDELTNVQSISACVNSKRVCAVGNKKYLDNAVTNMRVSFAGAMQTPRVMREVDDDGSPWPEESWDEFMIDGPGGEVIDEIGWVRAGSDCLEYLHVSSGIHEPKFANLALKLRTNRERAAIFAADTLAGENDSAAATGTKLYERTTGDRMQVIRAGEGDVIVGIVMGFGHRVSGRLDGSDAEEFATRPWTCETFQKRSGFRLFSCFSFVGALTMAKDA